jgi:hypothetical protein
MNPTLQGLTAFGLLMMGGFLGYYLALAHVFHDKRRAEAMNRHWTVHRALPWYRYFQGPGKFLSELEQLDRAERRSYGLFLLAVMDELGDHRDDWIARPRSLEALDAIFGKAETLYQQNARVITVRS